MTVRRRVSLWAPVVAYMALIFSLSARSEAPLPDQLSDKQGHSLGYFGLSVLATRAVAGGLPARVGLGAAVGAWAIAAGYGVTDELHQSFVPGRRADVSDVYADAIGALAGTVTCWAWGIIRPRADV